MQDGISQDKTSKTVTLLGGSSKIEIPKIVTVQGGTSQSESSQNRKSKIVKLQGGKSQILTSLDGTSVGGTSNIVTSKSGSSQGGAMQGGTSQYKTSKTVTLLGGSSKVEIPSIVAVQGGTSQMLASQNGKSQVVISQNKAIQGGLMKSDTNNFSEPESTTPSIRVKEPILASQIKTKDGQIVKEIKLQQSNGTIQNETINKAINGNKMYNSLMKNNLKVNTFTQTEPSKDSEQQINTKNVKPTQNESSKVVTSQSKESKYEGKSNNFTVQLQQAQAELQKVNKGKVDKKPVKSTKLSKSECQKAKEKLKTSNCPFEELKEKLKSKLKTQKSMEIKPELKKNESNNSNKSKTETLKSFKKNQRPVNLGSLKYNNKNKPVTKTPVTKSPVTKSPVIKPLVIKPLVTKAPPRPKKINVKVIPKIMKIPKLLRKKPKIFKIALNKPKIVEQKPSKLITFTKPVFYKKPMKIMKISASKCNPSQIKRIKTSKGNNHEEILDCDPDRPRKIFKSNIPTIKSVQQKPVKLIKVFKEPKKTQTITIIKKKRPNIIKPIKYYDRKILPKTIVTIKPTIKIHRPKQNNVPLLPNIIKPTRPQIEPVDNFKSPIKSHMKPKISNKIPNMLLNSFKKMMKYIKKMEERKSLDNRRLQNQQTDKSNQTKNTKERNIEKSLTHSRSGYINIINVNTHAHNNVKHKDAKQSIHETKKVQKPSKQIQYRNHYNKLTKENYDFENFSKKLPYWYLMMINKIIFNFGSVLAPFRQTNEMHKSERKFKSQKSLEALFQKYTKAINQIISTHNDIQINRKLKTQSYNKSEKLIKITNQINLGNKTYQKLTHHNKVIRIQNKSKIQSNNSKKNDRENLIHIVNQINIDNQTNQKPIPQITLKDILKLHEKLVKQTKLRNKHNETKHQSNNTSKSQTPQTKKKLKKKKIYHSIIIPNWYNKMTRHIYQSNQNIKTLLRLNSKLIYQNKKNHQEHLASQKNQKESNRNLNKTFLKIRNNRKLLAPKIETSKKKKNKTYKKPHIKPKMHIDIINPRKLKNNHHKETPIHHEVRKIHANALSYSHDVPDYPNELQKDKIDSNHHMNRNHLSHHTDVQDVVDEDKEIIYPKIPKSRPEVSLKIKVQAEKDKDKKFPQHVSLSTLENDHFSTKYKQLKVKSRNRLGTEDFGTDDLETEHTGTENVRKENLRIEPLEIEHLDTKQLGTEHFGVDHLRTKHLRAVNSKVDHFRSENEVSLQSDWFKYLNFNHREIAHFEYITNEKPYWFIDIINRIINNCQKYNNRSNFQYKIPKNSHLDSDTLQHWLINLDLTDEEIHRFQRVKRKLPKSYVELLNRLMQTCQNQTNSWNEHY